MSKNLLWILLCWICTASAFLTGCSNMLAGTSEEENGIIAEQPPIGGVDVEVVSSSSVVFPDIGGLPNDIESSSSNEDVLYSSEAQSSSSVALPDIGGLPNVVVSSSSVEVLGSSSSEPPKHDVVIGSSSSDDGGLANGDPDDGRFPNADGPVGGSHNYGDLLQQLGISSELVDESVQAAIAVYSYNCKSLVDGENVCEHAGVESGMVRILATNDAHFEEVFRTSWEFWQSQNLEEGCNYYLMINKINENVGVPVLTAVEGNRVEITQVKPMGVCNTTQETLYVGFLIQFCGEISRTPQVDYKTVESSNWNCGDYIEFYGEWRKL